MVSRLISRGIHTTLIAAISAEVSYHPIRRTKKCPEGFLHHSSPLSREVMRQGWRSASGRIIDIVRADERDRDLAGQFFGEEFSTWNNCCKHTNMSFEDFETISASETDLALKSGDVFMAFEGDKLVGTLFNSNHNEKEFEQMFHGEMPGHPNPIFRVRSDYTDLIASYPYTLAMNKFMALMDIIQPQTGKFLPATVRNFGITETFTVHPSFHNEGIGDALLHVGDEVFRKRGVSHVGIYCLSYGAQKIAQRLGYKSLYQLPYADFKAGGKPVYENMYDGAKVADTLIREL